MNKLTKKEMAKEVSMTLKGNKVKDSFNGEIISDPPSPGTAMSPVSRLALSPKAKAVAEAHQGRVEAEAQAYFESKIRKLEAKAQKLQAKAERQRMHEEAKALETQKREELRSEQLLRDAQVKADKILSEARQESHKVKSDASEQKEKAIGDANARAEMWKAVIDEKKKKEVADITERVHLMIAIGELPSAQRHKGMLTAMKQIWA